VTINRGTIKCGLGDRRDVPLQDKPSSPHGPRPQRLRVVPPKTKTRSRNLPVKPPNNISISFFPSPIRISPHTHHQSRMLKYHSVVSSQQYVAIPKTGNTSHQSMTANSFVHNILRISPAFTIFCPDAAICQQPNLTETKILAYRYKKNIGKSTRRSPQPKAGHKDHPPASSAQTHQPENSILLGYN
jgi:hypothetical protein